MKGTWQLWSVSWHLSYDITCMAKLLKLALRSAPSHIQYIHFQLQIRKGECMSVYLNQGIWLKCLKKCVDLFWKDSHHWDTLLCVRVRTNQTNWENVLLINEVRPLRDGKMHTHIAHCLQKMLILLVWCKHVFPHCIPWHWNNNHLI